MKRASIFKISNLYFLKKKRFKFQVFFIYSILFILLFFSVVFTGTFYRTLKTIFTTKDNNYITVIPKSMDISFFKIETPSIFGKGKLSEKDVNYMNGLKDNIIVSPTFTLNAPSNLSGDFFEMRYGTDLSIFGDDNAFVKFEKILKKKLISNNNLKIVPAIISSKLLEIYNLSFAPANDLPKLSEKIIIGRKFDLVIGQNSFKKDGKSYRFKIKIIGLSDRVEFLGVTIPKAIMSKLAKKINSDLSISNIKIEAENSAELVNVTSLLEKKGYKIRENENELFKTINSYISKLEVIINIPVVFVFFIILLFIQNQLKYMMLVLKKEIGIVITFGIYYNDLILIWLFQYLKLIVYALIFSFILSYSVLKIFFFVNKESMISKYILLQFDFDKLLIYTISTMLFSSLLIFITLSKYFKKNSIVSLINE